jgi:hypothetical protein
MLTTAWFRLLAVLCLGLGAVGAGAAETGDETCAQIRAQIGVLPLADPVLLRKLAARKDCRFAPDEIYRAAYGDRPLPAPDREPRRHGRHGEDDD